MLWALGLGGTRRRGAGLVARGWEAWPSSEFPSAGNTLQTEMICLGWGWKGVRCEAEGPSASARGELRLATMWNAFSPEKRQREPWQCGSLRTGVQRGTGPCGGGSGSTGWCQACPRSEGARLSAPHIPAKPWAGVPRPSLRASPAFRFLCLPCPPGCASVSHALEGFLCSVAVMSEPQSGTHGLTETNMI